MKGEKRFSLHNKTRFISSDHPTAVVEASAEVLAFWFIGDLGVSTWCNL